MEALRNFVLTIAVLATVVSAILYCLGLVLSSKLVRELVASAWARSTQQAEQGSIGSVLRLANAMLLALFENERGFAFSKFFLLMLFLNGSAILGLFLGLDADVQAIELRESKGELSQESAIAEHDSVIDATIGMALLAPLNFVSWSLFDLLAFFISKRGFERAIQRQSASPIIGAMVAVLMINYVAPLLLVLAEKAESGLALLYVLGSPLTPALNTIRQVQQCWMCSLLTLPAGLSASLSILLLASALLALSRKTLLHRFANLCERVENANPNRMRNVALEIGTVAGIAIVLLTWKQLFPNS